MGQETGQGLGGSSVPRGVVGHHSVVFGWWIAGLQSAGHPLPHSWCFGGWLEGWALLRLDLLCVASPAWHCQDNWTWTWQLRAPERVFQGTGGRCRCFPKAWAQKPAKHHFHHTLLSKVVTGTIWIKMRQHRSCLLTWAQDQRFFSHF